MKENKDMIVEGFWDNLITKTKQGALAVAGALGSSKARGKLSASLLSDAMMGQWQEYQASTDSELNKSDFQDFLRRMGFSVEFADRESSEMEVFLGGHEALTDREPPASEPEAEAEPESEPEAEPEAPAAPAPTPATPERRAAERAADDAMERNQRRRNRVNQESVATKGKTLNEAVVSDGELRKFFDQMAKRALKSGDAKSAAQKSVKVNRISQAQPKGASQAAPEAPDETQDEPADTAAPEAPAAPAAQPAAPTGLQLSAEEKQFFDAMPADSKIGTQVKAGDPLLQDLAQKVMQSAFERYKAANAGR